jgi:putative ABC transport system permease protein
VFNYYFGLAVRSLKRNIVLTVLMIAAVGVGIGASMTTLTVFRAMDNDPIPTKSRQLFAVQIDNWGPDNKSVVSGDQEHFQEQISYIDAVGLMNARTAHRQTATYLTGAALTPANSQLLPFQVQIRATYTDFFSMFETPFLVGGPWSADDDKNHTDVAIITQKLNDKVFGGGNSVGKTINLDNHDYRVVGVLGIWAPTPQFYDLNNNAYGEGAEIYIPFTHAIDGQMASWGNNNCSGDVGEPGWAGRLHSECVWIQFWAELPTASDVDAYRKFLNNYASD